MDPAPTSYFLGFDQNNFEANLMPRESKEKAETSNTLDDETDDGEERLRLSSYSINPLFARKDTEARQQQLTALRNVKLFPVFNDGHLAKISLNYFLYLEFIRMAIGMFFVIFIAALGLELYLKFTDTEAESEEVEYEEIMLYYSSLGVFCTFLLRFSLYFQNKKLLKHSFLYECQWSEEYFSLLVEGIPINATRKEVKEYFISLIQTNGFAGRIIDVLFIQDYSKHYQIKKELKAIMKKLSNRYDDSLSQKEKELKNILMNLEQEILDLKHFQGKAIVIFNTMQTQTWILNFLSTGWMKSLLVMCFPSYYKSYYLQGKRITVKELPEPQNLIFANLHYSPIKKALKSLLAYIMSFFVVAGVIFGIGYLESTKFHDSTEEDETKKMLDGPLASYGFVIMSFTLTWLLEECYKISTKLLAPTSSLEKKYRTFTFKIYLSITVYGFIQISLGFKSYGLLFKQVFNLVLMFALKVFIKKAAEIYAAQGPIIKYLETADPSSRIKRSLAKSLRKWSTKFAFTTNLGNILPPIFIGVEFLSVNSLVIMPIIVVSLYILAIIDKYKMIKCCKLFSSKSGTFMLKHFSVYRYVACLSCFFTLFIMAWNLQLYKISTATANQYAHIVAIGVLGFAFSCCCCCSLPLHARVKNKFLDKNGLVGYDSVCENFSSFYQREDLLYQIKEEKNCAASISVERSHYQL